VPAVVLALTVGVAEPPIGPVPTWYGSVWDKVIAFASPVVFFGGQITFVFALLLFPLCLITRRIRVAPEIWPMALGIGVIAGCAPNMLWGFWGMDLRLPMAAAMLVLGATSPTGRMSPALRLAIMAGILVLTFARTVSIATTLQGLDREIAEVRDVVAAMPSGKRLLIATTASPEKTQGLEHAGTVAVIDRNAFVPNVFTNNTILHIAPSLRASSTPIGQAPRISDLADGLGRSDTPGVDQADGMGGRVYWLGWEKKFDYVLILHRGVAPAMLPPNLRQVATSPVATLYRIVNS
jgi:hypothetical protein